MSRWWRAYDEAVDDPKLILLTDKQHRAWFNLCCICSQSGGKLPAAAVIAVKLRMVVEKAKAIVAELAALGLVDVNADGATMHNWDGRQFQSDVSTSRVKRFRKRKRNVSAAVSETAPDTETETDSSEACASATGEPAGEDPKAKLFRVGKTILASFGVAEKRTGSLIGQWLKARDDPLGLLAALQFARDQNVAEPVAYVSALVHGKQNGEANGQGHPFDRRPGESLGDQARRLAAEARNLQLATSAGRTDDAP